MTDSTTSIHDRLDASVAFLRQRATPELGADWRPRVGLILGSGLGGVADDLAPRVAVDYADIPHFPEAAVAGHAGALVMGELEGVRCAALQGRVHLYEGHPIDTVVYPARVLVRLGCEILIVTNAAGGISNGLAPGRLMLIRDYINLMGRNPLCGPNDEGLGVRFPDMTSAFDADLRRLTRQVARDQGVDLAVGVYAGVLGPSYETPAEVEMLHRLGASAVGMSTVPETIAARHMGARVLGISCITNMAAGRGDEELDHDDVMATARRVQSTFVGLLRGVLAALGTNRDAGG